MDSKDGLLKFVEKYDWKHIAEKKFTKDNLLYKALYNRLSASIVFFDNNASRQGRIVEAFDDRRSSVNSSIMLRVWNKQYALELPT